VSRDASSRAVRSLGALALALWATTLLVWSSGGAVVGPVSVRSPWPLFLAACLVTAVVWLTAGRRRLLDGLAQAWTPGSRWPAAVAVAMAAATLATGIGAGSFIAGGADSSGYVSQSRLWLDGRLTQRHELATRLRPSVGPWAFAPLGYRPGADHGTFVPTYSPGYPLVFAAARAVGGERAGYLVVPVLGALLVWLSFALGRRFADARIGLGTALLVATSPAFLYQIIQPMSDVPAAAWWAFAALGCMTGTPAALLGGGLAASMAVLTRPNLVPLAAALGLFVLLQSDPAGGGAAAHPLSWYRRHAAGSLGARLRRAAVFSAGVVPGCVAVALLNDHLYGSPLLSGYGPSDYLYDRANVRPNLHLYAGWLWETHARVLWLAPLALAPWVTRRIAPGARMGTALLLAALAVVTFGMYLPYAVFENWSYLRFLLPGLPFCVALAVTALLGLLARLPPAPAACAGLVVLTIAGGAQLRVAFEDRVFDLDTIERRYLDVAAQVSQLPGTPPIVLAVQHSGSLAYYTHASILRWDLLDASGLDATLDLAAAGGRPVLLVFDHDEEGPFRARFAGHPTVGRLDWPPRVRTIPPADARIYDVSDRERYLAGNLVPLTWAGSTPRR